jgi:peptidyl-prolyl cis-trans isomerase A (cyclophilin A)
MTRSIAFGAALITAATLACGGSHASSDLLNPNEHGTAPDSFTVNFETTKGTFAVQVHRAWAPLGADRFYYLVRNHFYDENRFFRVVPGFVVQWGISGNPEVTKAWTDRNIRDDSVRQSNGRGTITFATGGPNTRTTQLFINLADNARLNRMGFSPFGRVISGMNVVDSLDAEYGETPDQSQIEREGNNYLTRFFPRLDEIKSARIVP